MSELRLLKRKDMLKKVSLSRMTVEELINKGSFPHPVRPGTRDLAWVESEIDDWIRQLIKERAEQLKTA